MNTNEIDMILRALSVNDTARLVLKPIVACVDGTFAVQEPWRKVENGRAYWNDAEGDCIYSALAVDSMNGREIDVTVAEVMGDGMVRFTIDAAGEFDKSADCGEDVVVTAAHLLSISRTSVRIDGLKWPMHMCKDGRVRVGCQTLTPAGALAAFKALGDFLGYDVEE